MVTRTILYGWAAIWAPGVYDWDLSVPTINGLTNQIKPVNTPTADPFTFTTHKLRPEFVYGYLIQPNGNDPGDIAFGGSTPIAPSP